MQLHVHACTYTVHQCTSILLEYSYNPVYLERQSIAMVMNSQSFLPSYPQEVLDVAQNILAFLKSNCTREGHTYWMFRRKGEDLVKIYDLTSLTSYEV